MSEVHTCYPSRLSARYPQHTHSLCTQQRCTLAIVFSFFLPVLVCLPSYLTISIREVNIVEKDQVVTLYHLGLSDLAKERGEFLYILNFWVYSVFIKLLPCTILTVIRSVLSSKCSSRMM